MKNLLVITSCLLVSCSSSVIGNSGGVQPRHLEPQEWAAINKPGEIHSLLDVLVGEWDVDVLSWGSPSLQPVRSKARSSAAWVLGYRYVREKFQGIDRGYRYEGLGFIGYDQGAQRFSSVWMDSLNTAISVATGTLDRENSILEFRGEIYDPLLGRNKETRTTIQIFDSNAYTLSLFYRSDRGEEFRALELKYKRSNLSTESKK